MLYYQPCYATQCCTTDCFMLCYATLRYAMLYYAIPCYAMLRFIILRYAMLCYVILLKLPLLFSYFHDIIFFGGSCSCVLNPFSDRSVRNKRRLFFMTVLPFQQAFNKPKYWFFFLFVLFCFVLFCFVFFLVVVVVEGRGGGEDRAYETNTGASAHFKNKWWQKAVSYSLFDAVVKSNVSWFSDSV